MERTGSHELSAAYALDALDADERREFEGHLTHCPECREAVGSFQETASALAHHVDMPPPPPALRERILEQARRERSNVVPLRPRWVFPATATVAAVAACAAIGLGIWAATLNNQLDERPEAVQLTGASGSVIVTPGREATLVVKNLEAPPPGKTYEAWVIQGEKPLPAGTFSGGDRVAFILTRKAPEGAIVAVTLEPAGGVEQPTTDPLFRSREPV
jgi:anti-sigma-K factor RskA